MLIIALVLALVGLAALVAAVVTSNELIAWVCIGASVIGVLLLIGDALRSRRSGGDSADDTTEAESVEDYPEEETTVTESEQPAEPSDGDNAEADTEIAGVTEADTESEAGGAVEISPDPEGPAKS